MRCQEYTDDIFVAFTLINTISHIHFLQWRPHRTCASVIRGHSATDQLNDTNFFISILPYIDRPKSIFVTYSLSIYDFLIQHDSCFQDYIMMLWAVDMLNKM